MPRDDYGCLKMSMDVYLCPEMTKKPKIPIMFWDDSELLKLSIMPVYA